MREKLEEQFPNQEMVFVKGMDDAIIGYDERTFRVVYSVEKMLDILMDEYDMNDEQAWEYYAGSIRDKHMGDQSPIYLEESVT